MNAFPSPQSLHRIGVGFSFVTAALGGILLSGCWPPLTHIVFAVIAIISLLNTVVSKSTTAATVRRILLSIVWVWGLIIAIESIDALYYHTEEHIKVLQDGVVWFGGMFLCYLTPAAATAMLYSGERTGWYDRWLACSMSLLNIAVAGVAIFTNVGIVWPFNRSLILPYIWFGMTILSAVLLLLCVFNPTEIQQTALQEARDRRNAKREEKRKARQQDRY